jgi:hypothetical protein
MFYESCEVLLANSTTTMEGGKCQGSRRNQAIDSSVPVLKARFPQKADDLMEILQVAGCNPS